ncbi:hypothetical protein GOP47_0023826 [Adiantum capillus-veneris]|uniref:CBS domain-containing protein n=1 Tax=Adiantum capillus-veneris TaxID=13818 RepID=A0A9D4U6S0_ADICA|nr:hypothetical protein GOP47_0023826 [Adiantum capillus-veneris]
MDLSFCLPSSTSSSSIASPPLCGCSGEAALSPSCCRFPSVDRFSRASCSANVSVSVSSFRSHTPLQFRRPSSHAPCAALMENPIPAKQDYHTVGEFMTTMDDMFVVNTSTTVDEALELLVQNRITGLPVVDDAGKLIGVVSDFDLLALDAISGKRASDSSLFPEAGSSWKSFKELQKLISKTQGKTVGEVMTPSPLVVRGMTNLEDAARLLLETKYRRLPVVDDSGRLIGLLTRGNVIRAALKMKREAEAHSQGA